MIRKTKDILLEGLHLQGFKEPESRTILQIFTRGIYTGIETEYDPENPNPFADFMDQQSAGTRSWLEMPFGKHKGVPLNRIPFDYLTWLEKQVWFTKKGGMWQFIYNELQDYKKWKLIEAKKRREEQWSKKKKDQEIMKRIDRI